MCLQATLSGPSGGFLIQIAEAAPATAAATTNATDVVIVRTEDDDVSNTNVSVMV